MKQRGDNSQSKAHFLIKHLQLFYLLLLLEMRCIEHTILVVNNRINICAFLRVTMVRETSRHCSSSWLTSDSFLQSIQQMYCKRWDSSAIVRSGLLTDHHIRNQLSGKSLKTDHSAYGVRVFVWGGSSQYAATLNVSAIDRMAVFQKTPRDCYWRISSQALHASMMTSEANARGRVRIYVFRLLPSSPLLSQKQTCWA